MTIAEIVKEICKREGLKSETSRANVKEIIGHLCDLARETQSWGRDAMDDKILVNDGGVIEALLVNGDKRAKRKKKNG